MPLLNTPMLDTTVFDAFRVFLILITFAIASKSDIKNRIVKHKTWIIPTLLGFAISATQITLTPDTPTTTYAVGLTVTTLTLIATALVAYALFKNHKIDRKLWATPITLNFIFFTVGFATIPSAQPLILTIISSIAIATILGGFLYFFPVIGMGGADFVAIIVLGVLLPTHPELGPLPLTLAPALSFPTNIITLPVLNVITNTGFLIIVLFPILPLLNILQGNTDKPFLTAFTVKTQLNQIEDQHGQIINTWTQTAALPTRIRKTWNNTTGNTLHRVLDTILETKWFAFGNYFTSFDTFFINDYLEWRRAVTDDDSISLESEDEVYLERFINTHQEVLGLEEEKWGSNDIESDQEFFESLLQQDTIRLMPGLPFIVPLFIGTLTLLTIGDILFFVLLQLNGI